MIGKISYDQYKIRGSQKSLDVAVRALRVAMDLTEDNSLPDKIQILSELAEALHTRFKYAQGEGDTRNLDEAIELQQLVDALTPNDSSEKSSRLNNLAVFLRARHEREGQWEDLEEAIVLLTRAIELSPDSEDDNALASMPRMLNNLGTSLLVRSKRSGKLSDLERAISILTSAVDSTPDDHQDNFEGTVAQQPRERTRE